METFFNTFKIRAHNKAITKEDMLAHCVVKTLAAKSEDKQLILDYFIKRTFTPGRVCPHRYHPYQSFLEARRNLLGQFTSGFRRDLKTGEYKSMEYGFLLGMNISDIFDKEQCIAFKTLLEEYKL